MVSVDDDDLAGLEDVSSDGEDDNYEAEPTDDGTDGEVIVEAEAAPVRKPYKKKARGKIYVPSSVLVVEQMD